MKETIKRISAVILALILFTQSCVTNVSAAETTDPTAAEVVETEVQDSTQAEETDDEPIHTEKVDIIDWINENIPEDYSELSKRPQEWWDGLTDEQRRAATIFTEQIVLDDRFYHEQSLTEVIEIIEGGEAEIDAFFEKTIFQNMTLDQLHQLKKLGLELDDLADIIFDIWDGKESVASLDQELLDLAVLVSGISMAETYDSYSPTDGDNVAQISTKNTGYTNGKGLTFWILKDKGDGSYVYCMDHGKSCSRKYIYGNMQKLSGEAAWLIQNYGPKVSSDDAYMVFQMAVWALQNGSSAASVRSDAYAWFIAGGFETSKANLFANSTEFYFNLAKGKNGTCWIMEGPAGSQRPAKPIPFVTIPYGNTGGEQQPEETVEPEFETIQDSIRVSYEVKVRKTDWQTNVGLAGCKVNIYENGSKIATVTTDSKGEASYSTSKSAEFYAEYCTNYEELTAEQQAGITCCKSLAEAHAQLEAKKADFANRSYTYSCREVTAPTGYVWQANEKSASVKGNGSATLKITNERTLGAVELVKYDTESESDATQGEATLEGAVYGIYAAEAIIHQDKKTGVIYQKDQLIATGTIGKSPKRNADGYILNTDGSRHIAKPGGTIAYVDTPGKTLFGDLELGKYYVKEITPATGYLLDESIYEATFTYKDQKIKIETRNETAADAQNPLTVDDESESKIVYSGDYVIKQGIQFVKTSDNAYQTELQPIAGAGFSVYLIRELTGVKNGTLTPINGSWGADDIMTFYDYDFSGESKAVLYKRSNEAWTAGDTKWLTSLGGNQYEVAEMFTDEDGCIETPELPFGTYVIVETTTPEDHVCAKPFIVYVTQDGGVLYTDATKQTVEKTYTAAEAVRYGDRPETKDREGRMPQKQRVINNTITKTYLRVIKTDEEFALQPGNYIKPEEIVRGTVLKEGAEYRLRCLTVDASEESLKALNWKYDGDGYLSYYDAYTKSFVGTPEIPFTTFFLNVAGTILDCYITLPQELPIGSYELVEITAPEGYVINGSEQSVKDTGTGGLNGYEIIDTPKTKVVFTIGNGSVYPDGQMGNHKYALQDSYGNLTVTVLQKNQEQKGIIEITKHGEQLSKFENGIFEYEDAPVEGSQFQIIAVEDIYTQELDRDLLDQYDIDLDAYLLYKKGDVVATITTDRHGWGYAAGLYIGKYKIVEKRAGNGFILNIAHTEFEIQSMEQHMNFDIRSADYRNERQKLEINVTKTDAETEKPLAGAMYGVYAAEDIYTNIEYDAEARDWIRRETPVILIPKDTLLGTCVTDVNGKATFSQDLPLAKYTIRELEAPPGYVNGAEDVFIDASYDGSPAGQKLIRQIHYARFANEPTKIEISKKDLSNQKELPGATLEIYDENGQLVTSWISTDQPHLIKTLPIGKYTLVEKEAPSGYAYAENIEFEVLDTKEIQKVEMLDDILGIEVGKSTSSKTNPGAVLMYTVDVVKNWTDQTLEQFTLTDRLPQNVRIKKLWTGTFSDLLDYAIEYQTNQNENWRSWKTQISTAQNEMLELPKELKSGEYITAFRFCFGTVPGQFENVLCPRYEVIVLQDASGVIHNEIKLTATLDGKPLSDEDETDTEVEPPAPTPKPTPHPKLEPEEEPTPVPPIVSTPYAPVKAGDRANPMEWCATLFVTAAVGASFYRKKKW